MPKGISFNLEELRKNLGNDVAKTLFEQQKTRVETRSRTLAVSNVKPISKEQLQNLISTLEDEVRALCKE